MYKGHKFILCIKDDITNYLITVLIHQSRSVEIGDALIETFIAKSCVPNYIIMDQDSAFMSSLMNYLFKKLDIKIKYSGILQTSIITGITWYKIIIFDIDQTFNGFRSDVAKIFAFSNSGMRYLQQSKSS